MQAVIMAGGFGTRLKPLTNNIPKPMVPVTNKPILEHLISLLKKHNIKDYVMLLYYQSDIIKEYFGDGSNFGVSIEYITPDKDFGTAGAVKLSEKYIKDNFLVISGDVLTDIDLTEFYNYHISKNNIATIALYNAENPLQYGIVLTDKDNKIVSFLEKPSSSEVFSDTINTGIYYFEKKIFEYIPENENFDFSKDLFPHLLENNIPVFGYKSTGYWRDVGNLEEYLCANLDVLQDKLDHIKARDYYGNCVASSAVIEQGVTIDNSVIGENVYLGKGVQIKNSVIWDNVKIYDKTSVLFDVIGKNTEIGEHTRINDYVFIGDDCKIGKNVFVSSSLKIWNKKTVGNNAKITRSLIYEDTFFNELFTDSRISGLSNLQINPEFASKLGSVYGVFIGPNKNVIVGRDSDDISNMIKRSVTSGILSAGLDVHDLQVIPIPMLRQELKNGAGAGGIFVRKSPFDKDITDIIFFDRDGRDLSSSKTKSFERLFFSDEYQRAAYEKVGKIVFPERKNEKYKEHFIKCLDLKAIQKKKFKLVIDYSHGIASTIFPNILGDFKCEVVSLSAHLDKDKITRDAGEFKSSIDNFCFVVKSLNFDYGFMIDAGGEKIWLATREGKLLSDDRFLVIVLKLFLLVTHGVKKVAIPVQATGEVDFVAREYGVEIIRVKNTHYSMMAALDDKEVKFAGGTRRGFLFPEFLNATDGMYSIAKILELISLSDMDVAELDNNLPKLYRAGVSLECLKEDKGMVMRKFMEETIMHKQQLIDGVKIFLNETDTVLCMPDKARDFVHLNVETDNREKSEQILNRYRLKVESYISK
ncbi:MAG: NTP transferase domain-containing protein [Ignavibacteria bacterium]|nr:NTP transferase domain-containing protein [Ignavibacteria bacterium]